MLRETPKPIYLKDYTPSAYLIETVDLHFDLGETITTVRSRITFLRNKNTIHGASTPLVLNGERLVLKSIVLNGDLLEPKHYQVDDKTLTLTNVPESFTLEITTEIKPQENTALEGLYQSNGNFCTQCEAHGFRKITYFLDRPDVLARFSTTIVADKTRYPVLLSNGNLVGKGDLDNQQHWVKWQDPFKKPCYLFALVAGDFAHIEDHFVTRSQRKINLKIFVEKGNQHKCSHAMQSLKKAMRWDEETYGREYDLDIFMIVAVSDFNMGAMENKGLNIFNDRYILADTQMATDSDYAAIESVIGHEYFHNWTGNRVTCRDWFQLSLKEGLTVFRDQEFSADMQSRPMVRVDTVRNLRSRQFPEDAGPLAHPVRPDSYIEMNNFYTSTIYNKGAEVIRMMNTLLGKTGFRKGMDLYFERHDGQAVTCDDFVKAMEDANDADLKQFRLWYSQAGTPELTIERHYDAKTRVYTLTVKQQCSPTPSQPLKEAMHIPLAIGLIDASGKELPLTTPVLEIKKFVETFHFENIPEEPTLSLLRNFSAPVKLKIDYSFIELEKLLAQDSNPFNRWEASQQLAKKAVINLMNDVKQQRPLVLDSAFVEAFRQVLNDAELDKLLKAQLLLFPGEMSLADQLPSIDVEALYQARCFTLKSLAKELKSELLKQYHENESKTSYQFEAKAVAQRALKNTCLSYLMLLDDPESHALCFRQYKKSDNMTDRLSALRAISHVMIPERVTALNDFYQQWQKESLVIDKWFSIQALAELPDTLQQVKSLMSHSAFTSKNPNKVRALIGAFCSGNFMGFHAANGEGYQFLAEQVLLLNKANPIIAARLLEPLTQWRRYEPKRQALMKMELEKISQSAELSNDVYEIVFKSLNNSSI